MTNDGMRRGWTGWTGWDGLSVPRERCFSTFSVSLAWLRLLAGWLACSICTHNTHLGSLSLSCMHWHVRCGACVAGRR